MEKPSGLHAGEDELVESPGINLHSCTKYRWPRGKQKIKPFVLMQAEKKRGFLFYFTIKKWRKFHSLSIETPLSRSNPHS